eukprot:CAMPEP_0180241242 /NCGR_PEP_ID=MMETSP0987-20121128/32567_1 /TAXON_ID=697907 /ORGANISM="non described non described, Strain CCMP2293" /LENGTH=103 /DNA_ID=CAMNT_0022208239 /DNA_START=220 /DNA_END=531 /DNA_ORIENTATION=+
MPRPTALRALPQPGGASRRVSRARMGSRGGGRRVCAPVGARPRRAVLQSARVRVREEQSCLAVGDEFGDAAVVDGEHGQLAPEHVHHLHGEVEARGGGVEAEP